MSEQHLPVGTPVAHGPWRGVVCGLTVTDDKIEYYAHDEQGQRRTFAAGELQRIEAPMTVSDYQAAALRTANHNLTGDKALIVAALGLTGEAGEVADLVKKHVGQGHPYDQEMRERLIDEAGDIAWYLANLCAALMVPMEDVLRANIEKLAGRYPAGFSSERSRNREPVAVKGE